MRKLGCELSLNSLTLLKQLTNLKRIRLNAWAPDLMSQTLTSLVSLRSLEMRSKVVDEDCMIHIADNLTKLTRVLCATSDKLYRKFDS
jgi:hypothetical protein